VLPGALAVASSVHCGSAPISSNSSPATLEEGSVSACFPDADGMSGGVYIFALTVDDTGFSKTILATQNDAEVTLTLTNNGTTPHGLEVGCVSVVSEYPDLPAGCPTSACFPPTAMIPPLAPGATQTITFDTPTPDNLIYPFKSSEPNDSAVPGLNSGQWTLM
jgi:hypothetical protein